MRAAVWLMRVIEGGARWFAAVQFRKHGRRAIIECTVRSHLVVVIAPYRQSFSRLIQRRKPLYVQAFIPQAAVEALDESVFYRSAGTDKA